MDKSHLEKVEYLALLIFAFQKLNRKEQDVLRPLLSKEVICYLKIIDCANGKTFEQIANDLNLDINTVKQKLRALEKIGYPIDLHCSNQ